nr:unnamed protein product [Callosobruchus chinensis]
MLDLFKKGIREGEVEYISRYRNGVKTAYSSKVTSARSTKGVPVRKTVPGSNTSGIVIKAELVKKFKTSVDVDSLGVEFKKLRRTDSGDLLVLVEGRGSKAGILKRAMEDILQEIQEGILYWWNTDIENKTADCVLLSRRLTRTRFKEHIHLRSSIASELAAEYRDNQKELRRIIKQSKKKHWEDLCSELENDIWGDEYRIVTKLSARIYQNKRKIRDLFPVCKDNLQSQAEARYPELFSMEELRVASSKLRTGAALGIDQITPEAAGLLKHSGRLRGLYYWLNKENHWKNRRLSARYIYCLLDVQNAFNTARWSLIVEGMRKKGIAEKILLGRETIEAYAGVPQGSALGPTLWNIFYDGVFGLQLPEDTVAVGYADDDLALVICGEVEDTIKFKVNLALEIASKWMKANDLSLAPLKSEVVVIKGA